MSKVMVIHRSRSFIDVGPVSLRFNIFKLLLWDGVMKVSTNGLCHMTKMAAMSKYDKNV